MAINYRDGAFISNLDTCNLFAKKLFEGDNDWNTSAMDLGDRKKEEKSNITKF